MAPRINLFHQIRSISIQLFPNLIFKFNPVLSTVTSRKQYGTKNIHRPNQPRLKQPRPVKRNGMYLDYAGTSTATYKWLYIDHACTLINNQHFIKKLFFVDVRGKLYFVNCRNWYHPRIRIRPYLINKLHLSVITVNVWIRNVWNLNYAEIGIPGSSNH